MSGCWVGIGANLGSPRDAFDAAWLELGRNPGIQLQKRSGIYQTRPVGQCAGGVFSNAVIHLSTTLAPLELLNVLQSVETGLGRSRELRWGPRPIDLDLLFVDQQVLHEPRLTLPHPAAWYRRFVIDPLSEIAPEFQHPTLKTSIADLKVLLSKRPLTVASRDSATAAYLSQDLRLQEEFPEARIVDTDSSFHADIAIRIWPGEPAGPTWNGTPVADLTTTPGDIPQRVADFLTSVLDRPLRVGDW